jgi:IMP dehydrogenase
MDFKGFKKGKTTMAPSKNTLENAPTAYTFDDFILAPVHSEVRSRKDPDVSTSLPAARLQTPVYSSPMNTVTNLAMAKTMLDFGAGAVLHRYMDIDEQIATAKAIEAYCVGGHPELFTTGARNLSNFFVAVGANGALEEHISKLLDAGVTNYCVDVANGHSAHCIDAVKLIKRMHSSAVVMAGNVCTYDGALNLADVGADLIRVGIGPGAVCTTRLVTGHGVPQLSAIEQCSRVKNVHGDLVIIADGGIRSSGDIVKALAIGADAVMLGSLLAGTSDTPGDTHKDPETNMLYKYYHGMASEAGRESWFDRGRTAWVPEGESTRVPYKGKTSVVVDQLVGGLKVGMSYAGAHDLAELRAKAQWIKVSPAGLLEGTPHGKR